MRYIVSLILGIVIAGFLFWIMRSFISGKQSIPEQSSSAQLVNFVSVPKQEQVRHRERKPPKKPQQKKPPPQMKQVKVSKPHNVQTPQLNINIPNIGVPTPGAGGSGPFLGGGGYNVGNSLMQSNGQAIPIVLIKPNYPRKALFSGTSGTVTAEFTVEPDGSASHIEIIKAKPTRVFNNVVKEALRRSKFKPKVVNGKPVAARYTYSFDFTPPNQR
jgi:protein TonB